MDIVSGGESSAWPSSSRSSWRSAYRAGPLPFGMGRDLSPKSRNRSGWIVNKLVRRTLPGRWFQLENTVSLHGVGRSTAVQVVVCPARPCQRPLLFEAPPVLTHDEDPDRRLPVHPVVDSLEPVVEPTVREFHHVDEHLRPEVNFPAVHCLGGSNPQKLLVDGMSSGSHDDFGSFSRCRRTAARKMG